MSAPAQKSVTILFCLPGRNFSGEFLKCWTAMVAHASNLGLNLVLSQHYNPVTHYQRSLCLQGNILRGKDQKPFDGKLDYDYMMWIDSDILFNPADVYLLLRRCMKYGIVSGLYKTANVKDYAAIKRWDVGNLFKNGGFTFLSEEEVKKTVEQIDKMSQDSKEMVTVIEEESDEKYTLADELEMSRSLKQLTLDDLEVSKELKLYELFQKLSEEQDKTPEHVVEVEYANMGFMMVKRGVFESLQYPWFYRAAETYKSEDIEKPDIVEMFSDSVAFCKNARDAGHKIYVDLDIKVGHEKRLPIM